MNKSFQLLTMLAIVSCAKGNSLSSQNKVGFNLFSSSYDPCLVPNKCMDRKVIPPFLALKMYEESNFNSAPERGQQVKRNILATQAVFSTSGEMVGEVNCVLGFDQTRTIVDVKSNEIYVKEEKSNFQYQPKIDECRDLLKTGPFLPLLIAIEERGDLNQDLGLGSDLEQLKKLKMESLTVDNKKLLRISGVISSFQVPQDNGFELIVETSILKMIDLEENFFSADLFEHSITKSLFSIPAENVMDLSTVQNNVDVSDFDIDDYSRRMIQDRRNI